MDMETALLGGLIAGVLCGLVPLIYAASKGRIALGALSFLATVAAGLVLGLILAIPVAAVMTYIVHRSVSRRPSTRTSAA